MLGQGKVIKYGKYAIAGQTETDKESKRQGIS